MLSCSRPTVSSMASCLDLHAALLWHHVLNCMQHCYGILFGFACSTVLASFLDLHAALLWHHVLNCMQHCYGIRFGFACSTVMASGLHLQTDYYVMKNCSKTLHAPCFVRQNNILCRIFYVIHTHNFSCSK